MKRGFVGRLWRSSLLPATVTTGLLALSLPAPVAAQGVLAPVCNLGSALTAVLPGTCPGSSPSAPAAPPLMVSPPPATTPPTGTAVGTAGCVGLWGKTIIIGLQAQELTACQDSSTYIDTPITTGRDSLPTPSGSFSVLRKNSPWIMRSPWPRGSKYWYPASRVEFTLWFTDAGHAIHDAPWRTAYGPGTEAQGSHGCVNVPRPAMDQLFSWADLGTPVLIHP